MKRQTFYLDIEKIVYTFSKYDILKALLELHKIELVGRDYEFSIHEESEGQESGAELIVYYKTAVASENKEESCNN